MKLLLALLLLLAATPGYAQVSQIQSFRAVGEGGSSTGGADEGRSDSEAAWYLGHSKVRSICLAGRSSVFPITEAAAKQTLTRAYETWRNYVTAKVLPLYGEARTPSTLIRWEECTPATEIKVYLSGELPAELEAVKKTFTNPHGFVYRGSIWFEWSHAVEVGNNFLALALHEIGHTLGLPHVPGTIMTADIVKLLHQNTKESEAEQSKRYANMDRPEKWDRRDALLSRLEYEQALINPSTSDVAVRAPLIATQVMDYVTIRTVERTFEILAGRPPQGRAFVTFEAKIKGSFMDPSTEEDQAKLPEFRLILEDDADSLPFDLEFDLSPKMQREATQQDLFKVVQSSEVKTIQKNELRLTFKLTTASKKVLELTGTYWGGHFLNLSYLDQEPRLPEILKADPNFDHDIPASAMQKLRTASAPYHLFQSQSDLVRERWIWK